MTTGPRRDRPVVAVMLPYGLDVRTWRRRHSTGEVLDETPYGYGRAERRYELRWSVDHREIAIAWMVRRAVAHLTGADLVHVWRNRRLLRSADVVWTHTEEEHLAVAALRPRLGGAHLLAQTIWLWDRWPTFSPVRRALLARVLRRIDVEAVHSRVNLERSQRAVPARRVVQVPFGSEVGPVEPGLPRPLVFAPGNDRHRDWATLLGAARSLPDVDFLIASSSPFFRKGTDLPANVRREPRLDRRGLAAAYRDAAVVALPLHANAHASGATVAIEALGHGCVVVASDVGGLDDYLGEADGALVQPEDVDALATALARFARRPHRSERNASLPSQRGLTQADYVRRYELITEALLGSAWDPAISRFAPLPR